MQCTMVDYVDDLSMTCKDGATIAGVIEALKAKYLISRDVSRHFRNQGVLYHYVYVHRGGVKGCQIEECGHFSIGHLIHNQ